MRNVGDKLREIEWSCGGGWIPQPPCLKWKREEEKKGNILGVIMIKLGSHKSEKMQSSSLIKD